MLVKFRQLSALKLRDILRLFLYDFIRQSWRWCRLVPSRDRF